MADIKEEFNYTYRGGYYNSNDSIEIPENSIIVPSSNVIYNRRGRLISLKDSLSVGNIGGTRAFPLDSSVVGFLGADITSGAGIGNMFQGVGKNLWFVGNSVSNGVKAYSNFPSSPTAMQIGGVNQVETFTITNGATGTDNFSADVTGTHLGGNFQIDIPVVSGDTIAQVAAKFANVFREDSRFDDYYITYTSTTVILTDKYCRANDSTLSIETNDPNGSGVSITSSVNTTAGSIDTAADLSSTPQMAKWNGTGWNNPVQVGLAVQEDAPQLILTTDATRDAYFDGIITGSTSARIARKRNGSVSIASGASNIVTGDTDSCYVLIPDYPEDGSLKSERVWILYFTYKGKGSLAAHFQFPIEIPESKLDGSEANGWTSTQGNARIKVIEQHASNIANRKIEVEFYDNDLLYLEPFDDYYSADTCKFIKPLGNVMCLIGTGTDSTGFDVSYPNFREAFPPDWRDWFSEVPVAVVDASEQGFIWILTANTVYQAIWTGATQETAPVILKQVTSKFGTIGIGTAVGVNGSLYFLSKGGTPVRIAPNGDIDLTFANPVLNHFSAYPSTSEVTYDEATNSIIWFNGTTTIAFQIDNEIWGSTGTITTSGIETAFSINGHAYFCDYSGGTFRTFQYNGTAALNWTAVGSFQTGKHWLALKDIIEGRIITEAAAQPYTITVTAYKNFVNSGSPEALFTYTPTTTSVSTSPRKLLEKYDYEAISIACSGTAGGQTVHSVTIVADVHEIERQ